MAFVSKKVFLVAVAVCAASAGVAFYAGRASQTHKPSPHPFTGTVLLVRAESGKIAARNDDMPGFMKEMIMEYQVSEPATLASLKPGDNIRATLMSDGEEVWILQGITVTAGPARP